MTIPKKAAARIRAALKQFSKIIAAAKSRDVNESDTVTIITDMLADICGFDKYSEITREYAIRNTYCDLAIKIDDTPVFLIEVKAVGISLNEKHTRQAVNYAANEGIEWVILTNSDHWLAYRVIFGKPIKTELAFDFCIVDTCKPAGLVDFFFLLSKEGVKKSAISLFHEECQLTSKYMVAAAIQTLPVLTAIRRQLMAVSKKVKVSPDSILQTVQTQVLKREVTEGEEATAAKKRITAANKPKKKVPVKTVPIKEDINENIQEAQP